MVSLIQLVTYANVSINHQIVAEIQKGILALIGIEKNDSTQKVERLFDRIIHYRIFSDGNGKMNLSLKDVGGGLLLVPQFTLVAETNKGTRPGFSIGMPPEEGKKLFEYFVEYANKNYPHLAAGQFGEYMQVSLCNDGPVTFVLKV